jgi:DNA-directed RNA polymerase specialized sigma24 family protein
MHEEIAEEVDLYELYVEALLDHYRRMEGRTEYRGDYGAVDTLIDLETAIGLANLSGRQSDAIRLVNLYGYTHDEASKELSTSRPNVSQRHKEAVRKIADIYRQWEELDDEIQQT